jgi:predicted RNase H-like nuclease (RuvC/YqgF family)
VQALIPILLRYWKEILIGLLLLIVSASWYYDRSSLVKALDTATSRYEEELYLLKRSHTRELERKTTLVEEYEKRIEELRIVFEETQKEIESLKTERIEEVTVLRTTNPGAVAEQIEEVFGFTYVE